MDLNLFKKPLPRKAITKHPTKTYLSSIKTAYVTERLNEIFGYDGWEIVEVEPISHMESGMIVVKVTMIFHFPGGVDKKMICIAGNDNGGAQSKNYDLGDAYKGAITDAIGKIASWLDIGIEVFKGEHGKTPQVKEMTPEVFEKAKGHVKSGVKIVDIKKKYKLTSEQEAALKELEK